MAASRLPADVRHQARRIEGATARRRAPLEPQARDDLEPDRRRHHPVAEVYNRYGYLDEMRDAIGTWEQRLAALMQTKAETTKVG
jgi:hypothetical protein